MNNILKELTVLYAEDDKGIRDQIAHFLTHRCGRLVLAENGREALNFFMRNNPTWSSATY